MVIRRRLHTSLRTLREVIEIVLISTRLELVVIVIHLRPSEGGSNEIIPIIVSLKISTTDGVIVLLRIGAFIEELTLSEHCKINIIFILN